VYLSAGHGWVAWRGGRGWQRPECHGHIEDVWTARFVSEQLAPALERVGAEVLTVRERDLNEVSVLADDADPSFRADGVLRRELGGAWSMRQDRWTEARALASTTTLMPSGRAAWQLRVPHDGDWHLYAAWTASAAHDPRATYTIVHRGAADAAVVSQRVRGDRWNLLHRLEAREGDLIEVFLHGSGVGALSANAVRLGGGTQSLLDPRTGEVLQIPSWQVATIHSLASDGAPDAVWDAPGGGFAGDASARARWATWSYAGEAEAVYLSLHTDAGNGRGRGTTAYVRRSCRPGVPCEPRVAASEALASLVREAVVASARQIDPAWPDLGTRAAGLAEVNDELNPVMPAALIEIGYHDAPADVAVMDDLRFKERAADGIVDALIRYRARATGGVPVLPPSAPTGADWHGERVSWANTAASDTLARMEGWEVRTQSAEGWSAPQWVLRPEVLVPAEADRVSIRALNSAGASRAIVVDRPTRLLADGEGGAPGAAP
jgi:hypothetical protein